jgi:hypothetical protein
MPQPRTSYEPNKQKRPGQPDPNLRKRLAQLQGGGKAGPNAKTLKAPATQGQFAQGPNRGAPANANFATQFRNKLRGVSTQELRSRLEQRQKAVPTSDQSTPARHDTKAVDILKRRIALSQNPGARREAIGAKGIEFLRSAPGSKEAKAAALRKKRNLALSGTPAGKPSNTPPTQTDGRPVPKRRRNTMGSSTYEA